MNHSNDRSDQPVLTNGSTIPSFKIAHFDYFICELPVSGHAGSIEFLSKVVFGMSTSLTKTEKEK